MSSCGLRTRCSGDDVIGKVRNKCGLKKNTCRLKATNKVFGNPCVTAEMLTVEYVCKGK